ncbi:MAG: hypothetical protein OSJ27_06840 [Candidatus Gastranaerophilales bacterium]|nr:hypothetical protein [Candidatus Gastranaerophilales bacterium]
MLCTGIFGGNDLQNPYSKDGIMSGKSMHGAAFAYETVRAVTVIPEDKKEKEEFKAVTTNRHYDRGAVVKGYSIPEDKKEFTIPNPLDEITLRKIRETNRAGAQAVKAEKDKSAITIDSKVLEYFDERGEVEARGNVVVKSSTGTVITSDRATYDKNANIVKLFGNVVLKKDANVINGEYMLVDLNEENALIDSPIINIGSVIRLHAAEGYAYTDRFEAINGNVELARKVEMCLQTSGFNRYDNMLIQDDIVSFDTKKQRLSPYKIKTKEILVKPGKDHDSLILKNADLYYKKTKLVSMASMELFADKEMNQIEANIPLEMGSISHFGQYVGLGYIFKLPMGGNLKVAPALVYDDEFGVGVLGRLKTKRLNLEAAWATSSENLIVDGEYNFTDRLKADFARHAYKDEWFIGSKRAGHLAQLVYEDSYNVRDIDAVFKQRFTAGYASDYQTEHQERDNYGTMRLRWQAELRKHIMGISNEEQDMYLNFGALTQTMATVYGTGETFALVRGGPYIDSRIKNWQSRIRYAIGGTNGRSPFEFDEYTYGKSSIDIDESLKLGKYLSVGYRGVISPLKDNDDKDLLTENRFYAIAGPEDIKVAFSYDTIRSSVNFDFMFLLGTDSTNIEYDKITVREPDKLQKTDKGVNKDKGLWRVKVPEDL